MAIELARPYMQAHTDQNINGDSSSTAYNGVRSLPPALCLWLTQLFVTDTV